MYTGFVSFAVIPAAYPIRIRQMNTALFPFAVRALYDFITLSGHEAPKLTIIAISSISGSMRHLRPYPFRSGFQALGGFLKSRRPEYPECLSEVRSSAPQVV